jgi:hypothetical protein
MEPAAHARAHCNGPQSARTDEATSVDEKTFFKLIETPDFTVWTHCLAGARRAACETIAWLSVLTPTPTPTPIPLTTAPPRPAPHRSADQDHPRVGEEGPPPILLAGT